jgi:hypothetical protein
LAKDALTMLVMGKSWDLPHFGLLANSTGVETNVFPLPPQHVPNNGGVYLWQYFALHRTLLRVALIVSTEEIIEFAGQISL